MFALQTVFAGLLALFALLSCGIYWRLAKLQDKQHRLQYDPDLMVIGWVSLTREHGQPVWTGDLYFCNPGYSPIVLMQWKINDEAQMARTSIEDLDSEDDALSWSWGKVLLPGGSHRLARVSITGERCKHLVFWYGTASNRTKRYTLELVRLS